MTIYRRSGIHLVTRRPVATLIICVAFILVLQLIILLSWDTGETPRPRAPLQNNAVNVAQKLPVARKEGGRILGLNPALESSYTMDSQGMFECLESKELIVFSMVNDDYCDCKDGSDEPSTSACPGTFFFCSTSGTTTIPSSRVNDGVCDCCDGSDEYKGVKLLDRPVRNMQEKLGRFLPPCPNTCHELS